MENIDFKVIYPRGRLKYALLKIESCSRSL